MEETKKVYQIQDFFNVDGHYDHYKNNKRNVVK